MAASLGAAASRPTLRVAVTGAFLTGRPLRVRIGEYLDLQTKLATNLSQEGAAWSVRTAHTAGGGSYDSGGGFASLIPLVVARRDGPELAARARAAIDGRPDRERAWLDAETMGWELALESITIDVYDLGMAVLTGTFAVQMPAEVSLVDAVKNLKRMVWLRPDPEVGIRSPIAEAFQQLASETTEQFAEATEAAVPDAVESAWLAPYIDAVAPAGKARAAPVDWGRLLWLHPVHLLEIDEETDPLEMAVALAPAFHRTMTVPDGVFAPGVGWSVIASARGKPEAPAMPMELTQLQWAYYALYMEIDRGLLALMDDDRWYNADSLSQLERDADAAFARYLRVMEARARLDSALASLGGDKLAIWNVIADVQKFDALVDAVERKIEVLQRMTERRVQQATTGRAQRTGKVLSSISALTIVTVTVAVIGYFWGTRSDALGHGTLRVVVIVGAGVLATLVYREAYRERERRRGRGPRGPMSSR